MLYVVYKCSGSKNIIPCELPLTKNSKLLYVIYRFFFELSLFISFKNKNPHRDTLHLLLQVSKPRKQLNL